MEKEVKVQKVIERLRKVERIVEDVTSLLLQATTTIESIKVDLDGKCANEENIPVGVLDLVRRAEEKLDAASEQFDETASDLEQNDDDYFKGLADLGEAIHLLYRVRNIQELRKEKVNGNGRGKAK